VDLTETVRAGVMESAGSILCPAVGPCEHGKKFSSSIKGIEFLAQLGNYNFLKENSVPWN